jgi:type I restriction enzyme S subunit
MGYERVAGRNIAKKMSETIQQSENDQASTAWQTKTLGEVCDIQTGKWDANHAVKNGKYRFYTCAYEHGFCNTKRFSGECLIFPGNGVNVGEVFYFDGDFDAYQRTYVINNIKIFPRFLYYHLLCFWKERNLNKQFGSATNFLKIGNFLAYEILYPQSLSDQLHVVEILDEVFESIEKAKENAEKNLQNARKLFESYLQNVFANPGDGWEEKTLKQMSITFGRGKSKNRPRNDPKLYGGKYPFVQTGDIRNSNHFITEYTQTYNEAGLAQSKLWPKGTICITIAANIAETGILRFDGCFPDSVIGLVVNQKIADTDFVEYLLQSFKTRLQEKGKGSAQNNINMATFENEFFPFPPLSEQRAIVVKLNTLADETKKLEAIYQKKLADLEELKKTILQKAFNGKLVGARV